MGRNYKLVNGQLIIPNSLHSRQLDIEKKCPKPERANLWSSELTITEDIWVETG